MQFLHGIYTEKKMATLKEKASENIIGKGKNSGNQHFLLFHNVFFHIRDGQIICAPFNSLPNDKILDQSKLKALADDTINVNQELKLVLGRVENILGKGENAGYQHFLLFPKMFSKASFLRVVKSRDCVVKS